MKRIDYRNGMYFGRLNKNLFREGLGLLISDRSELVFGEWSDDQIDGQYFYSNGEVSAFGEMRLGQYDGYNIFIEKEFTLYANCKNNRFDGAVVIEFNDGNVEAYEFEAGRNVRILSLNRHSPNNSKALVSFVQTLAKSSRMFTILQLAANQMYVGATLNGEPSGLGFILSDHKVEAVGSFL